MELFKDKQELNILMDKVLIQTMELMQENVVTKVNMEQIMNDGSLLLAKTRYSEGQNAVSASKLPDEGSELCALRTIQRNEDEVGSIQFELECHSVDKETHHEDPIKWFGILVPQTLRTARANFEKSIELAIESANIEQRIVKNCENYAKLKAIKAEFENVEE